MGLHPVEVGTGLRKVEKKKKKKKRRAQRVGESSVAPAADRLVRGVARSAQRTSHVTSVRLSGRLSVDIRAFQA